LWYINASLSLARVRFRSGLQGGCGENIYDGVLNDGCQARGTLSVQHANNAVTTHPRSYTPARASCSHASRFSPHHTLRPRPPPHGPRCDEPPGCGDDGRDETPPLEGHGESAQWKCRAPRALPAYATYTNASTGQRKRRYATDPSRSQCACGLYRRFALGGRQELAYCTSGR
jgi:hypothetical protein